MNENILYPSKAEHRISELTSKSISNESKASIARWYAEMMIKEFLSHHFEDEKYQNESLSYLINELKGKVDIKIINSLRLIKDFGDKAAHYNPNKLISESQSKKAVDESLNLYLLVIIDILKKKSLLAHSDRATLISVLLPSMRINIYSELIDFDAKEIDQSLLKKWCIACTKDGRHNKAISKLNQLKANHTISEYDYEERIMDIKTIRQQMKRDNLPIPKNRADFARNLNELLQNHINDESKDSNKDLIKALTSMAENIEPSEMGHYKGMQVFSLTKN